MTEINYDVVIYGSDIQAFIAAFRAADELNTTGKKVALVIPDSGRYLGGLITSGGQNYWDTSKTPDVHAGSFGDMFGTNNTSPVYMFRRDELERFRLSPNLQANVGKYPHSHPYPLRFSG